ncbi:MAG: phage baseplate protein [Shewanella oncorhynchi]
MIGLYFGGQWFKTRFGNNYGNIELDLNLEEDHEWGAEATMNPVEDGSPVTDHVVEQPDKLSIKGFVTDTPLTITSQSVAIENRTQPVFDLLRELIKAREPVTVYTKYRTYPDMVITSINVPFNSSIGEAIEFGMNFVHIRKVATQIVDVPKGISRKKSAKAGAKVGEKSGGSFGKKAEPQKSAGKTEVENLLQKYPKPEEKSTSGLKNLFKKF